MSSRGIFILAITWIVMSPFWFWAENIALGIIWLCGGVIELFIALVRRSKEKKSKVFTTRDHPFVIECESDWELVETFFIGLVNEYLSSGKYAGKLKEYQAIGIGFVDGDLHILYAR